MIKKVLIILIIVILVVTAILWGVGEYFFQKDFKRKEVEDEVVVKSNVLEADSRNVEYLKAKKWWDLQEKEELNIEAEDGTKLFAYYLSNSSSQEKAVILAHGFDNNSESMALYAKYYYEKGFNVLVPDERGCGKSEGDYLGMGYLNSSDYKLWINKTIEKTNENVKIVLHGISMGAVSYLTLSPEIDLSNVKCIISDSAYSNYKAIYTRQIKEKYNLPEFPVANIVGMRSKAKLGSSIKDMDVRKKVQNSKVPTLYIHSGDDEAIPTYMAHELYDLTSSEKDIWIVENSKHANAFFSHAEEYKTKIEEFYNKYMG